MKDSNNDDSILGDLAPQSSKVKHSKIPEADPLIRSVAYSKPKTARKVFVQPAQVRPRNSHDTWDRIFRGFRLGNHMNNPQVRSVANEYTRKSQILSLMAKRSAPYLHMITTQVERRGMPAEVALLPFIESGFKATAYSRSGAAGLWQFMPATGKEYGLPRGNKFDARLDPFAATSAALNYLQKLNRQFHGDWLLTFAAYNAGGGKVSRSVTNFKRSHPGQRATFWNIDLPPETQRYVPKLLAFKDVVLHPNRYGFRLPYVPNTPQIIQVRVNKPVNLRALASQAGLPQYTLTELNPYFLGGITSPRQSNRIVMPRRHAAQISNVIRNLPPAYASNNKTARERYASKSKKLRAIRYSVRKRNNLQQLSKRDSSKSNRGIS